METNKHTGKPKLTLEQVTLCLTELKNVSGRELARRWGVSHSTINHVRSGHSWRTHIEYLGLPKWKKPSTKAMEKDPEVVK